MHVVELDPLSSKAKRAVDGVSAQVTVVKRGNFVFEPGRRRLPIGYDLELDTADVMDGVVELPARPPAVPLSPARPGGRSQGGMYAVEIELTLPDGIDRRMSLPARLQAGQVLLNPSSGVTRSQTTGVRWTRVRRTGDSVVAVAPSRGRVMTLRVPAMREVLTRLAPDVEFQLGDKGRYGRWVARHGRGLADLHELLTESRSRTLIAALRPPIGSRHTARQFLTFAQLRSALRNARVAGELEGSRRAHRADERWLEEWIDARVADELLRSGIRVRCEECLSQSFMDFDGFGSTVQCPRCGRHAPAPARPDVGFQLAEVAHLFFDNDCDVTALALVGLSRRSRLGYSYDFDHHVRWPKEAKPREIDFCGVIDGEVFVGESKKNGRFDQGDLDLLARLARTVRAKWVVLATGTGCESGCSEACARTRDDNDDAGDTSLATGTGGPGVRERVVDLRRRLERTGCRTIVMCRGDIAGPRMTRIQQRLAGLFA
jgi:hypothetical protein